MALIRPKLKNSSTGLQLSGKLRQGQFEHGEHDPCSRPKVLENFQLLGCLKAFHKIWPARLPVYHQKEETLALH